jgi:hypothetical protein
MVEFAFLTMWTMGPINRTPCHTASQISGAVLWGPSVNMPQTTPLEPLVARRGHTFHLCLVSQGEDGKGER